MRYSLLLLLPLLFSLTFCTGSSDSDPTVESYSQPAVQSELLLQTRSSWDGEPIVYPDGEAEVSVARIEIAPGEETGLHYHPMPSFNYLAQGTLEVTSEHGESVVLEAGDAVAEVTNVLHNGRNIGDVPVHLIIFYTGTEGQDLTISAE